MGDRGDDRTQRVLTGIGLALVGLFTLLSLVPVQRLGPSMKGLFPSGHIMGPVGAAVEVVAGRLLMDRVCAAGEQQ